MSIAYALSNSFGFGGTNGALLFKKFEDERSAPAPAFRSQREQAATARA